MGGTLTWGLLSTKDALDNTTSYVYDSRGRRTKVVDALGNYSKTTYDIDDSVLFTEVCAADDNCTGKIKSLYNPQGLKSGSAHVAQNGMETTLEQTVYDPAGRLASKTDARGYMYQFGYDALGRLTSVTDPKTKVTEYTYNERGGKLSEKDALLHTTTWGYDKMGSRVRRTLPLGMSETFTYNADGTTATRTDFNGATTTFGYDSDYRRLTTVSYPDWTQQAYTYDPISGRKLTETDSRGTTTYEYFATTGGLAKVTTPEGSWVGYTYDKNGNRLTLTTGHGATVHGTTTYEYDPLNRLETVTDSDGRVTTYTYNHVGKEDTVTYPNGTVAQKTYDDLGRLTYLENRKTDGTIITSYLYELDSNGNRTKVTENTGRVVDYTYDELNRLTGEKVTEPGGSITETTYTFDEVSNRLTKTDANGTTTYTYDANNRLTSDGTKTYTYDNNGNTLSDGSRTFVYDYENRMVSATIGTDVYKYRYNSDGIRTAKTKNMTSTTLYLVDSNRDYAQVMEETDPFGNPYATYTYGNDLIEQSRDSQESWYHYDGLGSTRALSDNAASSTDQYTYDAYGKLVTSNGTTNNNYLFTGEQFDSETDNYYLRARYYSPGQGRFITADKWGGIPTRTTTLNKYLYAEGNPIIFIDPSGHFTLQDISSAEGIQGILIKMSDGVSFALRVYNTVDTMKDLYDYASFALDFINILGAGSAELTAEYIAEKIAAKFGAVNAASDIISSFKEVSNIIGPKWPEIASRISNASLPMSKEIFSSLNTKTINKWLDYEKKGKLAFVICLPTAPGTDIDRNVDLTDKLALNVGISGGRLFGFGVKLVKANPEYPQIFRVDYYDNGQFYLHYHIRGGHGRPIP